MNMSQRELRGSMIRRQLQGRVSVLILSKMTNEELSDEQDYRDAERLRRMQQSS